jgi:hypothetical protein
MNEKVVDEVVHYHFIEASEPKITEKSGNKRKPVMSVDVEARFSL